MATTSGDYFTEEDYLPPRSPTLQPIRVSLWKSDKKRERSSDVGSDDYELDLYSTWAEDLSSSQATQYPNKSRRVDLSLGSNHVNEISATDGAEFHNLAIEWHPSQALDTKRSIALPLRPPSPPNTPSQSGSPLSPRQSTYTEPYSTPIPIAPLLHHDNVTTSPSGSPSVLSSPGDDRTRTGYGAPTLPPLDNTIAPSMLTRNATHNNFKGLGFYTVSPRESSRSRRRERKRFTLPIIIDGETVSLAVKACPDTGSAENVIRAELAKQLGLRVYAVEESFAMANGKVVKSVGVATIRCWFDAPGVQKAELRERLEVDVHVFETLAVPAILGSSFLDETETFTKHRDRLVEERVIGLQSIRVSSIGKPRKGLVCCLDDYVGCANADTGSDLDLVSPKFVQQRGFNTRHEDDMVVEFADGSTGQTCGSIEVRFAIGNTDDERGFLPRGSVLHDLEFFILDSLTSDILVGQDTLEELNVISKHGDLVIDSVPQPGLSDCNIIRYIGSVERAAKSALKWAKELFRDEEIPESPRSVMAVTGDSDADDSDNDDELTRVQRENARREAETTGAAYACTVQGCEAGPFQTRYLLKAHARLHSLDGFDGLETNSSDDLFYCSVYGCGKSKKGYKTQRGLDRHMKLHQPRQ